MAILLTSFDTWLPHQVSNSSNDLLTKLEQENYDYLFLLKKLPVNTSLASQQVINKIQEIKPQTIICCGMAEKRDQLTIESNARCGDSCHQSQVDLQQLLSCLDYTVISHDAGNFVCEGLYYQTLNYLHLKSLTANCIFVHVPVLTHANTGTIYRDFKKILSFFLRK